MEMPVEEGTRVIARMHGDDSPHGYIGNVLMCVLLRDDIYCVRIEDTDFKSIITVTTEHYDIQPY
jgi:hypothetical protein